MKKQEEPDRTIHLLRCGGCQAAVVWDALEENGTDSNDAVVWDDGADVHSSLRTLARIKSSEDITSLVLEASKSSTETKHSTSTNPEDAPHETKKIVDVVLVNAYICHGSPAVRKTLVQDIRRILSPFTKVGIKISFPTVIHPTAIISKSAVIGNGCYVGPNSVLHTSSYCGDFCIVNSSSVIEHDCVVQEYVNINPGAVLCGMVTVNSGTTVGANAALRDHIEIAEQSVIGMQAGVVSSIEIERLVHVGVPCEPMVKSFQEIDVNKNENDDESRVNIGPMTASKYMGTLPQNFSNISYTKEINDSGAFRLSDKDRLRWIAKKSFDAERYQKYLEPSLTKGHLTNDGPLQRVVSIKIKEVCGSTRKVMMSASGTGALHTLGSAWEIKLGRRLKFATQSFTFPSSIQGPFCNAIILDMDEKLAGPCMKKLNEIVDEIDGIVVTNIFGHLSDCLAYESWCLKHNKLLLLDNAATPFGTCEDGRCIHDVGHGAFVSLHETKPIGRGEGGAIFLPSDLQIFTHRAMNFGFNIYSNERIGHRYASNWRMSDFAAAAVCDHLDNIIESDWKGTSESLVTFAIQEMKRYPFDLHAGLQFPNVCPCLWINVGDTTCDLDIIATYLQRCQPGIEAKRYYRPLGSRDEHPVAWSMFDRTICLPLNVDMTKEMVAYELDQLNYAITDLFG